MKITVNAALSDVAVDVSRRTLTGTVYRYGEIGHTDAGPLAVAASMPPPPIGLPLTREHDYTDQRGNVIAVDNDAERLRVTVKVADGERGDQALAEAVAVDDRGRRVRAGLSMRILDVDVTDGTIVSGSWEAIGQVAEPAYNSARIDQIAASKRKAQTMLTDEQRARLTELQARTDLDAAETTELNALNALAALDQTPPADAPADAPPAAPAAPVAAVAASVPAVPAGVPAPTAVVRETGEAALSAFIRKLAAAYRAPDKVAAIAAALTDVVHSDHTDNIEQPAWSGQLWSGLQYVPKWSDLYATGPLTNWRGSGWRFTSTPEMQDYAGDKAAIPTGTVGTEDSAYEAARLAVGVDIDRKFYDFPNEEFLRGLFEKIRESWEIRLDEKVRAFTLANAVAGTRTFSVTIANGDATVTAPAGTFRPSDVGATFTSTGGGIPGGTTILSYTNSGSIELSANATGTGTRTVVVGAQEGSILKGAARAIMVLDQRKVGMASWVMLNDEDMFSLLDLNEDAVPAFLKLWKVEPENLRSASDVPRGTILAGVKQAATLRTLPGSPIRVNAQNLANGGVDEAAFGYWAIEKQHTSAIVSVAFKPA